MLPDVQTLKTGFPPIDIEKVGVENIKAPLPVLMKNGGIQKCVANFSAYCSLEKEIKGINMSRIGRAISELIKDTKTGYLNLSEFVYKLMEYHQNEDSYIEAEFDYVVDKETPVSKLPTTKPIHVKFVSDFKQNRLENLLQVRSTEMSLCPCSKEMSLIKNLLTDVELELLHDLPEPLRGKILESGYGAHNQKSIIDVTVELNHERIYIEDILDIIEKSASAPTYTILKREDEKYVTEVSYCGGVWGEQFVKVGGGPRFVEDIVRHAASSLNQLLDVKINDYKIIVRNQESIHCEDIQAAAILTAKRKMLPV